MAISLLDYQRIFRVLYSTLAGTQAARTTRACLFYGAAGAYILRKRYGLKATPVAGLAVYRVSDVEGQNVIAYCRPEPAEQGTRLVVAPDAFHCWVDCGDETYDFMAPLFTEVAAEMGIKKVPRRMFVKPRAAMAAAPTAVATLGDFFHGPDLDLTQRLLGDFMGGPANTDLMEIASQWFVPNPKKMRRHLEIVDTKHGKVRWQLTDISLEGSW